MAPSEKISSEEREARTLVQTRERLFGRLQITFDMIPSLPAKKEVFLARADRSTDDLDEFEKIQQQLSRLNASLPPDSQVEIAQISTAYEELHFEIQGAVASMSVSRANASTSGTPARDASDESVRAKFAPIQIPKFKGNFDDFPSFRSLFDSLVHNSNLPTIQKFSFLKTSLEQPALNIIEQFEFIPENYEEAYKKLTERYTDPRLVGTSILHRLLNFKPLTSRSLHQLQNFMDVFCVQYANLKSLEIPDLADFIICTLALDVLDPETKRLFEDKYSDENFPTFKTLTEFIFKQCKVNSLVQPAQRNMSSTSLSTSKGSSSKPYKNSLSKYSSTKSFLANAQMIPSKNMQNNRSNDYQGYTLRCPVCQADHKIYVCPEFLAMNTHNKREKIRTLKLCFACLGNHARSNCTSKLTCWKCSDKTHHTFLHLDKGTPPPLPGNGQAQGETSSTPSQTKGGSVSALTSQTDQRLASSSPILGLLGTAQARIQTPSGDWLPCRIVIDPASESSFITEHLAQSLRLPRKHLSVDIVGVGDSRFSNHRGCIECRVTPIQGNYPPLSVQAIVLQSISSHLPKVPLPPEIRRRFRDLKLADPNFDRPGRIDILLGVQHYSDILLDEIDHLRGEPAALNSIFGYLIFGKVRIPNPTSTLSSFFTQSSPIDELLRKFWENEEPKAIHSVNPDDEYCETMFRQTTRRDETGRYEVSLPFRPGSTIQNLGSTRDIARQRLLSLERRLNHNPVLRENYNANLLDYVSQNHMQLAPTEAEYLMTHHAVIKDSTSTKVRVVFNASEKSNTSTSLNDLLYTGPKLQADIADIILRFRLHKVALTADISQMFRRIRLNPSDAKFTHLLWRNDYSSSIQEWEIITLPFGLACSPYLAQRTVRQLVEDEGSQFPLAAEALTSNIYVDDIVCSMSDDDSIIQLFSQLQELLNRGGFSLHKVSSNSSSVLDNAPIPKRETMVCFDQTDYVKLLGLKWDPQSDVFCYEVSTNSFIPTKRGILSQVARIFDVMGYLTPVTFWIKHLIQRLWLIGVGWDDELPTEISRTWHTFHSQLDALADVQIPRSVDVARTAEYSIVGFSDASEKGYAACVYLRVVTEDLLVSIYLLKAKSRVAPLKPLTIPRLELEGANLLTSILSSIDSFRSHLPSHTLFCFTDSQIVLAWLHTPPYQLKTYVANRVSRILEVIPASSWYHIEGTSNPADVASRGLFPQLLKDHKLWWEGPPFLQLSTSCWPISTEADIENAPEMKPQSTTLMITEKPAIPPDNMVETLINKFSNLLNIQRILAYVSRFVKNVRLERNSRQYGALTQSELDEGLQIVVRHTQRGYYSDVIRDVESGRTIKGFLRHLTPFVTDSGLLRVGGRLTYAPLDDAQKHPLLVPRQSRLAELICAYFHKMTLHGGPQLMQSLIQRKFWIPGIRSLLRNFVFKCLTCYRFKATPIEPFMSSVPSSRFQQARAFVNTGVDLAGPYLVKESKRRNARKYKIWIVLFICQSTRAIYLETVDDISAPTFLASLDRFIARRGIPAELLSDMGTNFVGAARTLREIRELFKREEEIIKTYCTARQIKWEFNPPAAPHFGGSWESGIKAMKHHLRRVMGDMVLTLPEFLTLLAKIEAILNSRPLCPISTNPSDGFDYLTPGHFLVGAPILLSRPEENYLKDAPSFTARWALITRCVQDFWKRWSVEYVHTLMPRQKWVHRNSNITPGTLVLLIDSSLPPNLWNLGRIVETLPGRDGIVRVVKLRTPTGIITRPLSKLCLLPIAPRENIPHHAETQTKLGNPAAGI